MLNKKISGFENEMEFVRTFNNKRVKNLDFIESLFGIVSADSLIKCWKVSGYSKVDIRIKIENIIKNISIKKGVKGEVHVEHIDTFFEFLKELKVSEYSSNEIKKYLYADGTNNGTGEIRQSVSEYKENNQEVIDKVNNELNEHKVLKESINRFIFKGRVSELEVDAIVYGIREDFLWATRDEILEFINIYKNLYSTALHFAFLTLQPWNRNLKRNSKYEHLRNYV